MPGRLGTQKTPGCHPWPHLKGGQQLTKAMARPLAPSGGLASVGASRNLSTLRWKLEGTHMGHPHWHPPGTKPHHGCHHPLHPPVVLMPCPMPIPCPVPTLLGATRPPAVPPDSHGCHQTTRGATLPCAHLCLLASLRGAHAQLCPQVFLCHVPVPTCAPFMVPMCPCPPVQECHQHSQQTLCHLHAKLGGDLGSSLHVCPQQLWVWAQLAPGAWPPLCCPLRCCQPNQLKVAP